MKRITLLIALCCAACNNDIDIPAEPAEPAEPALQIQLYKSDAQEVSVYSSATGSERRIDTMWVCVFNKEDSTIRTIEYTVVVDNDALSITSNGQMAVVTNVDTVRIPGDVTEQAVAKFRCVYPQGGTPIQSGWGAAALSDTIIVDTATILPKNPRADLIIISPKGGDAGTPIQPTYQDLVISTTGNLTEAVILFKYGNITHRLPIRKR
jgi:hypothetical protein